MSELEASDPPNCVETIEPDVADRETLLAGPFEAQGIKLKRGAYNIQRGTLPTLRGHTRLEPIPEILIFDVDGVLVDVRGSF